MRRKLSTVSPTLIPFPKTFLPLGRSFVLCVVLMGMLTLYTVPAHATATISTAIPINGQGTGKTFDGIGAISGGGVVIQYADHGGANQQWQLANAGNGYYTLVNRNSGKVLDVPNYVTTVGVQLDQWTANGGSNQQWQLVPVS